MLHQLLQPTLGFTGACLSTGFLWLAEVPELVTPQASGWVQLGGTIGLITCLSYAVVTLWKELQLLRQKNEDLSKEIRDDWKAQNTKLVDVLNKLDPEQ